MRKLQWSKLLKQQDQYVHEEDRKQQERKLRMKQLYKIQLQKMIQYQQNHAQDQKDQDRRMVRWLNDRQQKRIATEQVQQNQKHKIKQEIARQNLRSLQNKKQKLINEHQEIKKFYGSKYRKVMTQQEEQTKSRLKHREQQKNQLAKAYDSQIKIQKNRMMLQKMENQRFAQLRDEIQRKKQQNRQQFFEKVRGGYKQNPEVYDVSYNALKQKQKQRNDFLRKIVNDNQQSSFQILKDKQQQQKSEKIKQTSNFNRNCFESKAFRQRYQSLQQISEYNKKYQTLSSQLQSERQKQLRQTEQKKRNLKIQLEKQINQSYNKIYFRNKMTDKQIQMNRSDRVPSSLPGLTKDYAAQKQQRILQNFLQGASAKKIQYIV